MCEGESGRVAGQQLPNVLQRQRVPDVDRRRGRDAPRLLRRPVLLGRRLLYHRAASAQARPVRRPAHTVHIVLRAERAPA